MAKDFLRQQREKQLVASQGAGRKRSLNDLQFLQGPSGPEQQAIEWLDVASSPGIGFYVDTYPSSVSDFLAGRLEKELEEQHLSVRTMAGRGKCFLSLLILVSS